MINPTGPEPAAGACLTTWRQERPELLPAPVIGHQPSSAQSARGLLFLAAGARATPPRSRYSIQDDAIDRCDCYYCHLLRWVSLPQRSSKPGSKTHVHLYAPSAEYCSFPSPISKAMRAVYYPRRLSLPLAPARLS